MLSLQIIAPELTEDVFVRTAMRLEQAGFIKKRESKQRKTGQTKPVTTVFLALHQANYSSYLKRIRIEYSLQPYKSFRVETEHYCIGASHLTLRFLIKRGGRQHARNPSPIKALIKLGQKPVVFNFHDWEALERELVILVQETRYLRAACVNDIPSFLEHLNAWVGGLEDLADELLFKANKIKTFWSRGLPAFLLKKLHTLDYFVNLRLTARYRQAYKIRENANKHRAELQSFYYLAILRESFPLESKKLYFSYSRDFRGRIYANSVMHPMYNKVLRAAVTFPDQKYSLGSSGFQKNLFQSLYFKKIKPYLSKLPMVDGLKLGDEKIVERYVYAMLLLEAGKLLKTKLIKLEGVTFEEFLKAGYTLLNNGRGLSMLSELSVEDYCYLRKLQIELEYYKNTGV